MFPASDVTQAKASANKVMTLMTFTCPARVYAGAMNRVNSKAYFYQFTRVPPGSKMGAFHSLEIAYVFGNFRPIMSPLKAEAYFDEIDRVLSVAMMSYWTAFAATDDPKKEGLKEWPVWDAKEGKYLDFGILIKVKSDPNTAACDLFMNAIKAKRGQ